jgi:hypothetical protein
MFSKIKFQKGLPKRLILGAIVFAHFGCAGGDGCSGGSASDAFTIVQLANYTDGPVDAKFGGRVIASKLNPNEVSCGSAQHQVDSVAEVGPPGFATPTATTNASLIAFPNLLIANGSGANVQLYSFNLFPLVTANKAQVNDFDAMTSGSYDVYLTAPGAALGGTTPVSFTTQKRNVGLGKKDPGTYIAQVTLKGSKTVLATSPSLALDATGYYALILSDAPGGGPAVHFIDTSNCQEQVVGSGGVADFINATVRPTNANLSAALGAADFGTVSQGHAGIPGTSPTLSAHFIVKRGGAGVFDQVYSLDDTHNYAFFGLDDIAAQPLVVATRGRLKTFTTDPGKGIITIVQGIATATASQALDVYVVAPNSDPLPSRLVAANLKYGSKVEVQRLAGPYQVVVTTPGFPSDIIARSPTDTLVDGHSVDQIDVSPPGLAAIFYRIDEGPAAVPKMSFRARVQAAMNTAPAH